MNRTTRWIVAVTLGLFSITLFTAGLRSLPAMAMSTLAKDDVNQLTDEEAKAGWKLLFNGKSFDGWHNFKQDSVRPGWQVKD